VTYRVELESRARAELLRLDRSVARRLAPVLDALEVNPRPPGAKKLIAQEGYRVRKGDTRILYTVDDAARVVRVYRIGHRSDVYRR
jgi:mRNA interferase RelE/StbE